MSIDHLETARSQDRAAPSGQNGELPYVLPLELYVEDREVIQALAAFPEGDARNQYALEALKIGILALRHVGGQASADLIQRESARLVRDMQATLRHHLQLVHGRLAESGTQAKILRELTEFLELPEEPRR